MKAKSYYLLKELHILIAMKNKDPIIIFLILFLFISLTLCINDSSKTDSINITNNVSVSLDKLKYAKSIKTENDSIYGDDINIAISNHLPDGVYINPSFSIPFTSVYIESYKNNNWRIDEGLHKIVLFPENYNSSNWLEQAKFLHTNETLNLRNEIYYQKDWDPYDATKYRIRVDYCYNLSEPDDWMKREGITSMEGLDKKFITVYSSEFKIY